MKYIKLFEDHKNVQIGHSSDLNDGWKERTVHMSVEQFFDKWYEGKKLIDEDDQYWIYEYHDKQYDEEEGEYFWETKNIMKVEKRDDDITHYFEKELISRPLYNIRAEGMTYDQEIKVRSWCGTEKNPKPRGKYMGFEKGLAIIKSFLSDKINGRTYHIFPNGSFLEMFTPSEDFNKEDAIDYLLDTGNTDLIKRLSLSE